MPAPLLSIREITAKLNIPDELVEPWGSHMAKLRLELLSESRPATQGKLIVVTAFPSFFPSPSWAKTGENGYTIKTHATTAKIRLLMLRPHESESPV